MGCDMGFDLFCGPEMPCAKGLFVRGASLQVCNMLRSSRLRSVPGEAQIGFRVSIGALLWAKLGGLKGPTTIFWWCFCNLEQRGLSTRFSSNKGPRGKENDSNLVDSASSHTLVSKIKPCMSKYKSFTLKLRTAHYISYNLFDSPLLFG